MRVRIRMSRQTRIRLRGGRELASMVARRNAVVNTAMTARDVSNSAYKLAYGRNPPSIRRLLLGRSRRHPPGWMWPFHGRHRYRACQVLQLEERVLRDWCNVYSGYFPRLRTHFPDHLKS